MDNQKQKEKFDVVEELKKLPNPKDYQNKPVKNTVDWFNMNLILLIIVTFIFIGLLITYAII